MRILTHAVYDHPLAKVTSRESLFTHFILLHLLSAGYLPSLSPSALIQHARSITSALRTRLLGGDEHTDIETSTPKFEGYKSKGKGKEKAEAEVGATGWYGLDTTPEERRDDVGWWKAWDVSADCREIGGMECYGERANPIVLPIPAPAFANVSDGYHLALIEQYVNQPSRDESLSWS